MSNVIHESYTGVRVTIKSTQSFEETDGKLREALRADLFVPGDAFGGVTTPFIMSGDVQGYERAIKGRVGPFGFMIFDVLQHDAWLPLYNPKPHTPRVSAYTIGNPVIAQTMLVRDYAASLHVPVRICVLESEDSVGGSSISYVLPSSHIAIGALKDAGEEAALKKAATDLDDKLEALLRYATGTEIDAKA